MADFDALTPEQEAEVGRLLASVRVREPMPAEVVDRMESTLAELAADRSAEPRPAIQAPAADASATVVDLSARRARRRRGLRGLVAAAAVVGVVGLGGPAFLNSMQGQGSDSSGDGMAGAGSAPESVMQEQQAGPGDGGDNPSTKDRYNQGDTSADSTSAVAQAPTIREGYERADVRAALRRPDVTDLMATSSVGGAVPTPTDGIFPDDCVLPGSTSGGVLPIRYTAADGTSSQGVLVLGPRGIDSRRVEVWLCGGEAPEAVVRRASP